MIIRVSNNYVQGLDQLITEFLLSSVTAAANILGMIQKPAKAQQSLHNIAKCLRMTDVSTSQSVVIPQLHQHVCICHIPRIEVGLPRTVISF